jgi:hypothetical protein
MPEKEMKVKSKARLGRPPKHGGYSLIHRDELIKNYPKLRRYLEDCRAGLVQDVAGTEDQLSEQQRIMIDRIISRLSICRLIEIYIEKYGAFRRDRLKRFQVLELEPALGQNYLAFSNSIDRALIALGLNHKKAETILTPLELAKRIDEEKTQNEKSSQDAKFEAINGKEIGEAGKI